MARVLATLGAVFYGATVNAQLAEPHLIIDSHTSLGRALSLQSGPNLSVHYPVANAICRILNQDTKFSQDFSGSRCRVSESEGIAQNRRALSLGQTDIALSAGVGGGDEESRNISSHLATSAPQMIAPLYQESLYILAKAELNIESLDELYNHRLNIGQRGSDVHTVVSGLLKAQGWSEASIETAVVSADSTAKEFCSSEADVLFVLSGQPSALIKYLASSCSLNALPLEGTHVDNWLAQQSDFRRDYLINRHYTLDANKVASVSRVVSLVAKASVPKELIQRIRDSLQRHSHSLARLQPVLGEMNSASTVVSMAE